MKKLVKVVAVVAGVLAGASSAMAMWCPPGYHWGQANPGSYPAIWKCIPYLDSLETRSLMSTGTTGTGESSTDMRIVDPTGKTSPPSSTKESKSR